VQLSSDGCSFADKLQRPLSNEAELQRLYFTKEFLPDAYELRIQAVRKLEAPEHITGRKNRKSTESFFSKSCLRHRLFVPYWGIDHGFNPGDILLESSQQSDDDDNFCDVEQDSDADCALGDTVEPNDVNCPGGGAQAQSVQEQLDVWGVKVLARHIGCLFVPEPLVDLVDKGAWHTLLFLARWHPSFNYKVQHLDDHAVLPGPLQGWPPESAELWNSWKLIYNGSFTESSGAAKLQLTAEACRTFAGNVSRWSTLVLEHCSQEATDSLYEQTNLMGSQRKCLNRKYKYTCFRYTILI
jgi:hypothetical protein